jgi:dCTP deaminase
MILSDIDILKGIERKQIIIDPFDIKNLRVNSYDVHLGDELWLYDYKEYLDVKQINKGWYEKISTEGRLLQPNIIYLGSTLEYTETLNHVPFLEGVSSLGRLGLAIHQTAGKGDIGFKGHWTLELSVVQPIRIYAGMRIGQLIYFEATRTLTRYGENRLNSKYASQQSSSKPVPSRSYLEYENENLL